jgi:hypothetical protein
MPVATAVRTAAVMGEIDPEFTAVRPQFTEKSSKNQSIPVTFIHIADKEGCIAFSSENGNINEQFHFILCS